MTNPSVLHEFTQKVIVLAESEGVSIQELIRALQQTTVTKQAGVLPVIRRSNTEITTQATSVRKGPATFEDFYLYIKSVPSGEALHELTQLKRRDSLEYPKHYLSISEDRTIVGLVRQDRATEDPVTYAIFTFEPESRLVILSRVIDGLPEQIATPYRVSFDTLIGGNLTSWQYVFNSQGVEIKDTLSAFLNMKN